MSKLCVARDVDTKKKLFQMEAWRYWEIVEELNWIGLFREQAYEVAKWAMHAKAKETYAPEDSKIIFEIIERRSK